MPDSIRKSNRYYAVAVVLGIVVGVFCRVWHLDLVAIDHFDEGVYSSNMWFADTPDGQYPMRHLYAPPLLPAVIEFCQSLLGPTTLASILPSLVAGCLTLLLVWFALKRWYGPDAAVAGVWLAALSDFHQIYSRMALTDVVMGAFMLLAVVAAVEAVVRGGFVRCAIAGLAAGLCWWTKYNGWLALAVVGSGTVAWLVMHRPGSTTGSRLTWPRVIGRVAMIVGVAVVVWYPVLDGLQGKGGYAAVAANHKGYVNSISEWPAALLRQMNNHRILQGPFSYLGMAISLLASTVGMALFDSRFTWNTSASEVGADARTLAVGRLIAGLLVLLLAATLIGVSGVLLVVALGGIVGSLLWPVAVGGDLVGSDNSSDDSLLTANRRTLATWMIAAWIIGLLVATPAYRPYPRLTLPWLIAIWLGASIGFGWWGRALRNAATAGGQTKRQLLRPLVTAAVAGVMLCMRLVGPFGVRAEVPAWEDRKGLSSVADQIRQLPDDAARRIVFTHGEPSMMHLLNSAGQAAAPTVALHPATLSGATTMLLVGDEARRLDDFDSKWPVNQANRTLVLVKDCQLSKVVQLNQPLTDQQIDKLLRGAAPQASVFELFRIH